MLFNKRMNLEEYQHNFPIGSYVGSNRGVKNAIVQRKNNRGSLKLEGLKGRAIKLFKTHL